MESVVIDANQIPQLCSKLKSLTPKSRQFTFLPDPMYEVRKNGLVPKNGKTITAIGILQSHKCHKFSSTIAFVVFNSVILSFLLSNFTQIAPSASIYVHMTQFLLQFSDSETPTYLPSVSTGMQCLQILPSTVNTHSSSRKMPTLCGCSFNSYYYRQYDGTSPSLPPLQQLKNPPPGLHMTSTLSPFIKGKQVPDKDKIQIMF
ncbi:MAG: hypothetical protein EZS28_047265 [Streblomastix strix]|uniref:Uncharacterized protein n=1 Tax=Streblomastix strix TaxID=222440 RepID=A0A5J4TG31_9EUKA|nr:MAG: hypothetical protein EZS28_047265 [Streblomastix strix]